MAQYQYEERSAYSKVLQDKGKYPIHNHNDPAPPAIVKRLVLAIPLALGHNIQFYVEQLAATVYWGIFL